MGCKRRFFTFLSGKERERDASLGRLRLKLVGVHENEIHDSCRSKSAKTETDAECKCNQSDFCFFVPFLRAWQDFRKRAFGHRGVLNWHQKLLDVVDDPSTLSHTNRARQAEHTHTHTPNRASQAHSTATSILTAVASRLRRRFARQNETREEKDNAAVSNHVFDRVHGAGHARRRR